MAKVLLLNNGGFHGVNSDFSKVEFPVAVEAEIVEGLAEVSPSELSRIGVTGYVATTSPKLAPGEWRFTLGSEAKIVEE